MHNRRAQFILPVGAQLDSDTLEGFIKRHQDDITTYRRLDSYLDGERPKMEREAPNRLLAIHDYAGYITTLNSAYLVGEPVQYQASADKDITAILREYGDQNISGLDSELASDCSVYGHAFEMVYADENSRPRSAVLSVYNTFVVYDDTFSHAPLYGVCISPVIGKDGELKREEFDVIIADKQWLRYYDMKGDALVERAESAVRHFFGGVPIIEYRNNRHRKGDFESVLSLVDALNILQSDRIIDRERLVDALLAISGADMTEKNMADAKEYRVINLPDGGKAEYIIKNINEADAEVLRSTLEKAIHKFSMTPDMSDEEFSGNSSGVALSYKLLPFEQNTKTKERYFESGLRRRWELYNTFLRMKDTMQDVPASSVDVIFTRSLPQNNLEISEMVNNLVGTGTVSKSTLAAQIPFVKDAEEEVQLAKEEEAAESEPVGDYGSGVFNTSASADDQNDEGSNN